MLPLLTGWWHVVAPSSCAAFHRAEKEPVGPHRLPCVPEAQLQHLQDQPAPSPLVVDTQGQSVSGFLEWNKKGHTRCMVKV